MYKPLVRGVLLMMVFVMPLEADELKDDRFAPTERVAQANVTRSRTSSGFYHEAPMLAKRVEAGSLPPVEARLPKNPMLIQPAKSVGKYGGTWHLASKTDYDIPMFTRHLGYENLVRWNEQWTGVIPNVAQTVQVNKNATEYIFSLRNGLRWSDGAPFTADDIIFWYEDVLLNKDLVKSPPTWLTAKGKPVKVEKINAFTVAFRFDAPNGLFLSNLAHPQGIDPTSFPLHYLKQFHSKYNPDGIAKLVADARVANWAALFTAKAGLPSVWSDGRNPLPGLPTLNAWIVTRDADVTQTQLITERNPYYWKTDPAGNQLPYIDTQVYHLFKNIEDLKRFAYGGGVDMQDRHIKLDARPTGANLAGNPSMRVAPEYTFYTLIPGRWSVIAIGLNLTHRNPNIRKVFQNKDFRIGLSHAINRQRIINALITGEAEPYQIAPMPESPFYDKRFAHQYTEYDREKADAVLTKAGYGKRDAAGFRLREDGQRIAIKVLITDFEAIEPKVMAMVVEDWRAVGVDATIDLRTRQDYYEVRAANQHDAAVWSGGGGVDVILNPRYYLPLSEESMYGVAWAYWDRDKNNPLAQEPPSTVTQQLALYDDLLGTADTKLQEAAMAKILDIAAEQFYVMGVAARFRYEFGLVKPHFHNVPPASPSAWTYPNPAPTNPAQYFIDP